LRPNWPVYVELYVELKEDFPEGGLQLLEKDGRRERARTSDLYRVNVDLSLINRAKTGIISIEI